MAFDLGFLLWGSQPAVAQQRTQEKRKRPPLLLEMTTREEEAQRRVDEAEASEVAMLQNACELLDQHRETLAKAIVESAPPSDHEESKGKIKGGGS